jgi:hypothetical protein
MVVWSFLAVLFSLAVALALTILGSSMNSDVMLETGVVFWLSACFLFFVWLVGVGWSSLSRYRRGRGAVKRTGGK